MPRIKKSHADTRNFMVIPTRKELDDEEFMERKYSGKRVLGKKCDQ